MSLYQKLRTQQKARLRLTNGEIVKFDILSGWTHLCYLDQLYLAEDGRVLARGWSNL